MTTLAEIRRFIEGTDLLSQAQEDVKEIESSDYNTVAKGWIDLKFALANESEYADLFSDPYALSKNFLQKTQSDAETYLKGIDLQVQRPNYQPGVSASPYIDLYSGSASMDSNGDIVEKEDCVATLWGAISGAYSNLVNDWGDAYYDNSGGPGPGLATDWSNNGSLHKISMWDGDSTDNGEYCAAQGSLSAWAPDIVISGGNPSALNHDVFI